MAAHERGRLVDVGKRKELELSRYSHNLTNKILRKENGEVGREIPDNILTNFQKGSIADRDKYWGEQDETNFGIQMLDWLGRGETPGITQWIEKQTDADVLSLLGEVGLGNTVAQSATRNELQKPKFVGVLNAIKNSLREEGINLNVTAFLQDDIASQSLVFYANYLNPTNGSTNDTRLLIDTLVKKASADSNGDIEQTIGRLQKIAPLFQVAGMDMQEVLGALVVAKAHALDDHEKVVRVPQDVGLTEDEGRVWKILQNKQPAGPTVTPENTAPEVQQVKPEDESQSYTAEAATVVPLEAGREHNIQEVFTALKPEPTPGHKYWVEHVPTDFAEGLTEDQLKELGIAKTFFVLEPDGKHLFPNEAVFPQARALFNKDQRFDNAEALTQGDSGLFAEAAASAATPKEQMRLYQELGKTVLRVHEHNPHLLEEFLQAQSKDSIKQFGVFDFNKSARLLQQNAQEMMQQLQDNPSKNEDEINDKMEPFVVRERDILGRISQSDERLVSLRIIDTKLNPGENILDEMVPAVVDIPQTVNEWLTSNRVLVLQQALQKDPLTLTPEQIRQIEFLGHSVDTAKAIAWMKGEQPEAVSEVLPANPPSPEGAAPVVPSPETNETVESAQPIEPAQGVEAKKEGKPFEPMTLSDFFASLNETEKEFDPRIEKPRSQLAVDPDMLSEFHTRNGEDSLPIESFEINQKDNSGEYAIFQFVEGANGRASLQFNDSDPFLKTILQRRSTSEFLFHKFAKVPEFGFGPNTLLAYVIEAAKPEKRQELFIKLFHQINVLYDEHQSVTKKMHQHLAAVSEKTSFEGSMEAEKLFESQQGVRTRQAEILGKMQNNEPLTAADFFDIAYFALPFDLQNITEKMQQSEIPNLQESLRNQPQNQPINDRPE